MSETAGATTTHSFTNFKLDAAGFSLPGCDLKIANPDENGEGEAKASKEHTARESSLSSDFWVVQHKQVERICRDLYSSTGELVDVYQTHHNVDDIGTL